MTDEWKPCNKGETPRDMLARAGLKSPEAAWVKSPASERSG